MSKIIKRAIFMIVLSALICTGCSKNNLIYEKNAASIEFNESSSYGHIKMDFLELNGQEIRAFKAKAGDLYQFKYDCRLADGDIRIYFKDSKDRVLEDLKWLSEYEKEVDAPDGEININGAGGFKDVKSEDSEVKIIIEGKAADGSVELEWH